MLRVDPRPAPPAAARCLPGTRRFGLGHCTGYPPLQLPALCSSGSDLRGLGAVGQLWKSDMSRVGKVCSVNLKRRFHLTWIISLTIMLLPTPACILLQKMLTKPFQWVTSRTNFESLVHYKYSIKFNFTSVHAAAAHSLRSRSFAWCSQEDTAPDTICCP